MEEWEKERFHDKDNPEQEEVFAFWEKLPVKKATAFVLRKTGGYYTREELKTMGVYER